MGRVEESIRLTAHQRRGLQRVARSHEHPGRPSVRATIVLMSAEGSSADVIARVLGVGLRTVRRARRRWRRDGLESLHDGWRPGRPLRADAEYLELMGRVVRTDPRELGYCFAHWTALRLAAYLQEQTGVHLCDDWVRMRLRAQGFVWRKTKLTIRNLQNARGKKGGAGAPLEAPAGQFTSGRRFRVVVRGWSPLRSVARDHVRLSSSRDTAADRDTREESPGRSLRSLPIS